LPGRRRRLLALGLLVVAGVSSAVLYAAVQQPSRLGRTNVRYGVASAPTAPTVVPVPPAPPDPLVAGLQRSVQTAVERQRRTDLRELDVGTFALPRDFRTYRDEVDAAARSLAFTSGQASKLERLGRPAFVAAVARLQQLDYEDADHCRRAANLHRLLAQMTAIDGLGCEAVVDEPCEADVCRFLAVADGWRRLAQQHGRDDAAWRQLLVARGKLAGGER
jgi:hypothetical protein